ncbi:30S ribosomal protein S16 [bacterium (Candidatus Howlettbacteria) CG_4_10_14_3_um_filter_37_10]|nr:MAG: 30S ribosomal protein S16 [bacterium (Candidatus Howlettbacteria) CG23_combo_of_CG06-09_8_20_14_all_37_9]PIX99756.1 MAG: 30S ribosomal protein S16 [bacterium (Candidatus Howlettbacteria) CG_4_10_14_3_um_filter_37_10]PJB06671.1 MAG: 30S ribosomal protein S16 [bacterium (Candidatus Howlettbacteria) CG_4_9_14_3_um_filter_37_10]
MLRVRLTRTGKKRYATWRIVVADSRKAVTAKVIDYLGHYNPHTKEFKVDEAKLKVWFEKGAQPSNTVAKLFKLNKVRMPDWVVIKMAIPKKKEEIASLNPSEAGPVKEEKRPEAEPLEVVEKTEEVTEEVTVSKEVSEEESEEEDSTKKETKKA